jgi:hypothetical protein
MPQVYVLSINRCLYSNFFIQGHDAPVGVHPKFLRRDGASRTNHSQLIPRVAKELMEHTREYDNLCNAFEELFAWINEKVRCCALFSFLKLNMERVQLRRSLPTTYENLCIFADVLPGNEVSPAHPFGGFVLNINVVTGAHRDVKDLELCLVLAVGNHTGGELCLVEPGLVLRLRNGDMAIFPSGRLTHFNLHYQGTRASVVLHSDYAGKIWGENRMGWQHHNFMS